MTQEQGTEEEWKKVNIAPEGEAPHYIDVKTTLPVDEAIRQSDYAEKLIEALSS